MIAAEKKHEGSCLCGAVKFKVAGELGEMMNCHCTHCRKSHGAAFATYIEVPWSRFEFVKGKDHLTTFKTDSSTKRSFCKTCGSIVVCFADSDKTNLEISASVLDTPTDLKPAYDIYVRSKASWYDITGNRPQYKTNKGA